MSILASIQQEIADCLLADPFFAAIPVLTEQPRDVAYELELGVAAAASWVVIQVPVAQVAAPNVPGPLFDPVEIAVRVYENSPVAAGPHALEIAETALALLHLYRPTTINEVLVAAPQALRRVPEADVVVYEIRLLTQAGALYVVPHLDAPGVAVSGTEFPRTVTLSSDQPGAAIFYTLDGSQPAPRSPASLLYMEPFSVSGSALLRSRVWLAGYRASGETRLTLN